MIHVMSACCKAFGRRTVSRRTCFPQTVMLVPRKPVPSLEFDTLGGGRWSLEAQVPRLFTMIVFYRGLHCPDHAFARPHFDEIAQAIDFVVGKNYPARGEA